jgi:hypothetical protein
MDINKRIVRAIEIYAAYCEKNGIPFQIPDKDQSKLEPNLGPLRLYNKEGKFLATVSLRNNQVMKILVPDANQDIIENEI